MMQAEAITEVGIDAAGCIFVRPAGGDFEYIYRAGMGVYWNRATGRLTSQVPKEWSPVRWFRQIVDAVAGEYGVSLQLTDETVWSNMPADFRTEIEGSR